MLNRGFRLLMASLLMALLMFILPQALASEFQAVVTSHSMKVYRESEPHDQIGKLEKGTVVTVKDYNDKAAIITYKGYTGIAKISDLKRVKESSAETASSEEVKNGKTMYVTEGTKVYKKASKHSDSVKVKAGTAVNVIAVSDGVAKVEKNGVIGYMYYKYLSDVKTADVKTSSGSDAVFSGSNQEIIYKFLTQVMDLNTAAACGVLANIKYESDYKPTTGGDSGTSYGICQWHLERKTRLLNYCKEHGYDPSGLKGQLYYLQYELKNSYPSVLKKLKSVSNSAQGAYDAGYAFCYDFEAPSSRASRSVTRANYAKDTLWAKYKV